MQSYTHFTISFAIAGLASSTTKLAGFESAAQDNGTALYDEVLVMGRTTTGTTPTVNRTIDIWAWGQMSDTPTYPDVLDGTASAETFTSENVRNAAMELMAQIVVDATSDRTYWFGPRSVAALFGAVPRRWGLFAAQDTGAALNNTAGNHEFIGVGIRF